MKDIKHRSNQEPEQNIGAFNSLHREIDQLFDSFKEGFHFPRPFRQASQGLMAPKSDISEDDRSFYYTFELPGVAKEDVAVDVYNGVLSVRAEKHSKEEVNKRKIHKVERTYGSYERSMSLPQDVQEDKIEASFENGVLTISVPKSESAEHKKKTIKIK